MTQRDWQKDMEMMKGTFEFDWTNNQELQIEMGEALPYWLQEAKERGEREQRMKEALELMLSMFRYDFEESRGYMTFGDFEEVLEPDDNEAYIAASNLLRTLYPDTLAPKEGSS
ncbi:MULTISPECIES: hypothetical protein [unclassified Paenibacillus]|uniref:hypothetical protein n=1 Tax=unclassified Paenibacillus TaxID=185978 RepID=UPI002473887F|nr:MULTISPECIES: hypothetical protein [unclassified Paenibacillus]MDH6427250.1 hypothetical protein [Paenibacillus sp. PastH-4]MDH6443280.1 hypothetical protein [Paenibacillus sp. PastF-4]MDH6526016.1 hypothetical protein [Paenibacillus sp. PastH-3]